jgi:hypothetical protein
MHKDGNGPEEYEDTWCMAPPELPSVMVGGPLRIAVCDGATEGMLARRWAQLLASDFCNASAVSNRNAAEFAAAAASTVAKWPDEVAAYTAERETSHRPLKWYQRAGLAKGAFATLLSMQFYWQSSGSSRKHKARHAASRVSRGHWYASAVGDTCVFQVKAQELKCAFPLSRAQDFGNTPQLLGSFNDDARHIASLVQSTEGSFTEGDHFYICTDALAAWFLRQAVDGRRPWNTLNTLDVADLKAWVQSIRLKGEMVNDDVTLIHIEFW